MLKLKEGDVVVTTERVVDFSSGESLIEAGAEMVVMWADDCVTVSLIHPNGNGEIPLYPSEFRVQRTTCPICGKHSNGCSIERAFEDYYHITCNEMLYLWHPAHGRLAVEKAAEVVFGKTETERAILDGSSR